MTRQQLDDSDVDRVLDHVRGVVEAWVSDHGWAAAGHQFTAMLEDQLQRGEDPTGWLRGAAATTRRHLDELGAIVGQADGEVVELHTEPSEPADLAALLGDLADAAHELRRAMLEGEQDTAALGREVVAAALEVAEVVDRCDIIRRPTGGAA